MATAGTPGEENATVVERTGIALVHEGETIVRPAPGSEASLKPMHTRQGSDVHFYFPVEVVVVGGIPEADKQELEARIFESLHRALG